jgi:hypothetical protein
MGRYRKEYVFEYIFEYIFIIIIIYIIFISMASYFICIDITYRSIDSHPPLSLSLFLSGWLGLLALALSAGHYIILSLPFPTPSLPSFPPSS